MSRGGRTFARGARRTHVQRDGVERGIPRVAEGLIERVLHRQKPGRVVVQELCRPPQQRGGGGPFWGAGRAWATVCAQSGGAHRLVLAYLHLAHDFCGRGGDECGGGAVARGFGRARAVSGGCNGLSDPSFKSSNSHVLSSPSGGARRADIGRMRTLMRAIYYYKNPWSGRVAMEGAAVGSEVRRWTDHSGTVRSVRVFPDSLRILSGVRDPSPAPKSGAGALIHPSPTTTLRAPST